MAGGDRVLCGGRGHGLCFRESGGDGSKVRGGLDVTGRNGGPRLCGGSRDVLQLRSKTSGWRQEAVTKTY